MATHTFERLKPIGKRVFTFCDSSAVCTVAANNDGFTEEEARKYAILFAHAPLLYSLVSRALAGENVSNEFRAELDQIDQRITNPKAFLFKRKHEDEIRPHATH
jgi:hypothetical protein